MILSETPNYILAEKDYMEGMKYKDIASKYEVSLSTVKSWKTRYKWDRKGMHTKYKKVCVQKQNSKKVIEPIAKEVDLVLQNTELTDKQRLFCLYYVKSFNATKAYQKAYKVDYTTAASIGYRLLAKDGVKREIARLKQSRLNREFLEEADIFQKYMDIAFYDITDFVEFGREDVDVMGPFGPIEIKDDETGEKKNLKKTINTVKFKEHTEVDGTLISEVKLGKDGASIKLPDRMKALDWLANHMDMATEEQKAKIANIRANTDKLSNEDKDKPINIVFTKASEQHGRE